MLGLTFGQELPDQFPSLTATTASQLLLIGDLGSLVSERAALEREYAGKLQALARKTKEKRDKRLVEVTVGAEPSKVWNSEAAVRSTLQSYLTSLFSTTDQIASDHASLAEALDLIGAEIVAGQKKKEEMRKKHTAFSQRLLADRDKAYSDRAKAKQKYDDLCHEVEAHRQKREKAEAGDKHAERAARQYEQAEIDMWNGKNLYLISIATANRMKEKFYRTDLPALEDNMQSLWSLTTSRIVAQLSRANRLMSEHQERVKDRLHELDIEADKVDPVKDQELYVEWNRRRWEEPGEWSFEPCQGFFDTPEMSDQEAPKVYLQNKLIRSRKKLVELRPVIESKRREIQGLDNLREAYERQEGLGDPDEVMDNLLESLRQTISLETTEATLETEIATIIEAIGDDEGEARPHRFKPASFTIPTTCNYCGGTIWGIAKQGFVCKPCGYTVHSKCEMKVPADCKSVPAERNGDGLSRAGSRATLGRTVSSSSRVPAGVGATGTTSSVFDTTRRGGKDSPTGTRIGQAIKGSVIYDYEATSPFELTVSEGDSVELVEDDDGSGWVKVKKARSNAAGLVPASYISFDGSRPSAVSEEDEEVAGPGGAGQGCGKFVRALYAYTAQDAEELSLAEGERIELTTTGMEYGEGWAEGVKAGRVGIFPSNYVEAE